MYNASVFEVILKDDVLHREQLLEHVRVLELCTNRLPIPPRMTFIHGSEPDAGNVDRVVDKDELVVRGLMLERVTVLLTELHHLLDHLMRSISDLDGVGLDVNDLRSQILQEQLEVDHEQRAPLGHNVVHIADITERVVELGRGQSVHDVDDDLERIRKVICVLLIIEVRSQAPVQHLSRRGEVASLDREPCLHEVDELSCVRAEQVEYLDRRRMHGSNIE